MNFALDPAAALLLHRLKMLYDWLQVRPRHGASQHNEGLINVSLGTASSRFVKYWHDVLPWERELAVDRLLAAYCVTRTPHDDFVWKKLNYKPLRLAVGFKDTPDEKSLTLMDTRSAPYFQVFDLVRTIHNLCIESRRTDALNSCTSWGTSFLSRAGVTRGKLFRLEPAVQQQVVHEVRAVVNQVSERLRTGSAIDDVLPSADTVFSSAHDSKLHAATRFATFAASLDSLVLLYASSPSSPSDEAGAALLRDVRRSFEKRMTVVEVPSVVELRTAEVHFTMLSLAQQVQAVATGRAILFQACGQRYTLRDLPDAHQVRAELLGALEHQQLMRLARDAQAARSQVPH
ncbi:hypothetical protein JCM9279_000404 [Rhodotorula babjevae]